MKIIVLVKAVYLCGHVLGQIRPEIVCLPRQLIRDLMGKAVANKLTVMRAWAHSVDQQYPLETSPGEDLH